MIVFLLYISPTQLKQISNCLSQEFLLYFLKQRSHTTHCTYTLQCSHEYNIKNRNCTLENVVDAIIGILFYYTWARPLGSSTPEIAVAVFSVGYKNANVGVEIIFIYVIVIFFLLRKFTREYYGLHKRWRKNNHDRKINNICHL